MLIFYSHLFIQINSETIASLFKFILCIHCYFKTFLYTSIRYFVSKSFDKLTWFEYSRNFREWFPPILIEDLQFESCVHEDI